MVHPTYLTRRARRRLLRRLTTTARDRQSWLDVVWVLVAHAHRDHLVDDRRRLVEPRRWAVRRTASGSGSIPRGTDPVTLASLLGFGTSGTRRHPGDQRHRRVRAADPAAALRAAALLHSTLGRDLLCGRAELQQEVRRSEAGRAAGRAAEAESLRRLERDIHDGPQQRLVRLSMDLGRARSQLDKDPERARATLDGALTQARETVDELRSLSRGIAPPVLVDRGLEAALREAVARSVVPTTLTYDAPASLPAHVESARLLRRRRVPDQHRQAQRRHVGAAVSLEVRDGEAGRGRRGRRSRRRACPHPTAGWPASPSGPGLRTACSTSPRPRGGPTVDHGRSCRADSCRRRLGAAPRGAPAPARGGRARGGRGRGRRALAGEAALSHRPDLCMVDVRMPPVAHRRGAARGRGDAPRVARGAG